MKFLLDTNAVIALLKGHPGLVARVKLHLPTDFGLPAIVRHELYYGAFRSSRRHENLARIEALMFEVLDFDDADAHRSGALRAELATLGTPIGPYDVLIAGQALARDLTLVTHNTREFTRVPGLQVQDWE